MGAGKMGVGIAQVCAQAGYSVLLSDVDKDMLQHSLTGLTAKLKRLVERGHMTVALQNDRFLFYFSAVQTVRK